MMIEIGGAAVEAVVVVPASSAVRMVTFQESAAMEAVEVAALVVVEEDLAVAGAAVVEPVLSAAKMDTFHANVEMEAGAVVVAVEVLAVAVAEAMNATTATRRATGPLTVRNQDVAAEVVAAAVVGAGVAAAVPATSVVRMGISRANAPRVVATDVSTVRRRDTSPTSALMAAVVAAAAAVAAGGGAMMTRNGRLKGLLSTTTRPRRSCGCANSFYVRLVFRIFQF